MLLTGFDAPIEQVMYIDKKLREHNLLQAIARVNRTYKGKSCGYIVDYAGIGHHLKEALELYGKDDPARNEMQDAMFDIEEETRDLEMRANRIVRFFKENATTRFKDYFQHDSLTHNQKNQVLERCIAILESVRLREEFSVNYKHFLHSMNVLIPHPNATPYIALMNVLGYIHEKVKERFSDNSMADLSGVGNKVKALIHEHLVSEGVSVYREPVDLFSKEFEQQIENNKNMSAKASHMKHKLRYHIQVNNKENPAFYKDMSEKLEEIIQQYEEGSKEQYKALREFAEGLNNDQKETEYGLTLLEMKYYNEMLHVLKEDGIERTEEKKQKVAEIIKELSSIIDEYTNLVGFWETPVRQNELRSVLERRMIKLYKSFPSFYNYKQRIASTLLNIKKSNH